MAAGSQCLHLVVFNKVKGDSIEFKRFYKVIFSDLMELKAVDTAASFSLFNSDTLRKMAF
jgi:hypothetical protein